MKTHYLFGIALALPTFVQASEQCVILNAGHGGADKGVVINDINEKEFVLQVAQETETLLEAQNVDVKMMRSGDYQLNHSQMLSQASANRNCTFVNIHAEPGSEGVFYSHSDFQTFASRLQRSLENDVDYNLILDHKKYSLIKNGGVYVNFKLDNQESIKPTATALSNGLIAALQGV